MGQNFFLNIQRFGCEKNLLKISSVLDVKKKFLKISSVLDVTIFFFKNIQRFGWDPSDSVFLIRNSFLLKLHCILYKKRSNYKHTVTAIRRLST